jgi:Bacterial PH domain
MSENAHEYEFEDVPGLPGYLPKSEKLLWQGRPQWRSFLVHALHIRWVWAYFGAIMAWRFVSALADGLGLHGAIVSAAWLGLLGLILTAILVGFAVATARMTIYSITSKRIVMRYGIAIQMAINVPFSRIASVGLKTFDDGTGEIPVTIAGDDRFAFLVLWPNARRWEFSNPAPMLRSIPDAGAVAKIMADALAVSIAEPVRDAPKTRALKPLVAAAA